MCRTRKILSRIKRKDSKSKHSDVHTLEWAPREFLTFSIDKKHFQEKKNWRGKENVWADVKTSENAPKCETGYENYNN
jgi:hypothetical protein